MCHHHQIMLTSSLYDPIGGGLPIGHLIHLNYHQEYNESEETTMRYLARLIHQMHTFGKEGLQLKIATRK